MLIRPRGAPFPSPSKSLKFKIVARTCKRNIGHTPSSTAGKLMFKISFEHPLAPQDHDGLPFISSVTSPFFHPFVCISDIQLRLIDSRATFLGERVGFLDMEPDDAALPNS